MRACVYMELNKNNRKEKKGGRRKDYINYFHIPVFLSISGHESDKLSILVLV